MKRKMMQQSADDKCETIDGEEEEEGETGRMGIETKEIAEDEIDL